MRLSSWLVCLFSTASHAKHVRYDDNSPYLPDALAVRRLNGEQRRLRREIQLDRNTKASKHAHTHRESHFVPQTDAERYAAIFTWWNLLDAQSRALHSEHARIVAAYPSEVQLRRTMQLLNASFPRVRSYCEVGGVDGGHTLAAVLVTRPGVQATVFESNRSRHSNQTMDLLKAAFPGRIDWVQDAQLAQANESSCDLFLLREHDDLARRVLQMAAVPHARVIIEAANKEHANRAMRRATKRLADDLKILETYHFGRDTEHNPCRRATNAGHFVSWSCRESAFAVGKCPSKPQQTSRRIR